MKIFFILLFFNYTTSINYIILPLKKNREVFSQYQNILELLLNNEVYSEFYIGSPPQTLKGFFNFLEHDSYIKKKTINGVFDDISSLLFMPDISNWNTKNLIDISLLFFYVLKELVVLLGKLLKLMEEEI